MNEITRHLIAAMDDLNNAHATVRCILQSSVPAIGPIIRKIAIVRTELETTRLWLADAIKDAQLLDGDNIRDIPESGASGAHKQ